MQSLSESRASRGPFAWPNLIRNILLALTFFGALALTHAADAGGYCAIAYSKSTRHWGESYGRDSRAIAERRALKSCGASDAFVAGWAHNRYIALAAGPGSEWGFGISNTRADAERKALRDCPGSSAKILCSAHSFN